MCINCAKKEPKMRVLVIFFKFGPLVRFDMVYFDSNMFLTIFIILLMSCLINYAIDQHDTLRNEPKMQFLAIFFEKSIL